MLKPRTLWCMFLIYWTNGRFNIPLTNRVPPWEKPDEGRSRGRLTGAPHTHRQGLKPRNETQRVCFQSHDFMGVCVCVCAAVGSASPHGSLYRLKLMSWQWNSVSALGIGVTSSHWLVSLWYTCTGSETTDTWRRRRVPWAADHVFKASWRHGGIKWPPSLAFFHFKAL